MTVGRGQPWGEPGMLPPDGRLIRADHEIGDELAAARRDRRDPPVFGLLAGDLARTCGATGSETRLHSDEAQVVDLDAGEVLIDGVVHFFAAHLVIRGRTWLRGPIVAVMNSQFLGSWNVAPRAHPNDGTLDLFETDLPLGDRVKAWRRLPSGSHVPHPAIRQRRVTAEQMDVPRNHSVWLDGRRTGPARAVAVRVVPDAYRAVI